jgi:enoyl-[acyl-carrier-protein] reductase (NADH)
VSGSRRPSRTRRCCTALTDVADTAAFIASEKANAMSGTVVNLSGGAIVDKSGFTVRLR